MPVKGIPNKQRHYEEMLALDEIERVFEKEIASFVILKSEYLYEEVTDEILKAFYFERGTKRFPLAVATDYSIRGQLSDIPQHLIQRICKCFEIVRTT